jgi:hypothetical protein
MTSPDWEILSEKYLLPYIESNTKDYSSLFKKGASNIVHNQAFNMENEYFARRGYKTDKAKKDIHKQSIVLNSEKMLPYIQTKLIKDKKVIKYVRQEKEVFRNNIKWTEEEAEQASSLKAQGLNINQISKRLGRSYISVYKKLKTKKV